MFTEQNIEVLEKIFPNGFVIVAVGSRPNHLKLGCLDKNNAYIRLIRVYIQDFIKEMAKMMEERNNNDDKV